MTSFKCRRCGNNWQEGPTRDHREDELCRFCLCQELTGYRTQADPDRNRDHEEKAEAREAGTERARADYYKTLCELQKGVIEDYRNFLFISNPQKINAISPREWDLGRQVYYLQKDNEALRELSEEYRKTLEAYAAKIN